MRERRKISRAERNIHLTMSENRSPFHLFAYRRLSEGLGENNSMTTSWVMMDERENTRGRSVIIIVYHALSLASH